MSNQQNPFEADGKKSKRLKKKQSIGKVISDTRNSSTVRHEIPKQNNSRNQNTNKHKFRLSNSPKLIILIIVILSLPTILTLVFAVTDAISYSEPSFTETVDDYYMEKTEEMKSLEDPDFVWDTSLIDTSIGNSEMFDFMTLDSFDGQSKQVAVDVAFDDEETLVDTSDLETGIYTVTNTDDMGYLSIYFRAADIELTVFDDEPIYNIPVTDGVEIYLNGADSGPVNIDFEAQSDYVEHSSTSYQGLYITGLSQFDNELYEDIESFNNENIDICYPQINEDNEYEFDCLFGSKEPVFNIPGSFQVAHH